MSPTRSRAIQAKPVLETVESAHRLQKDHPRRLGTNGSDVVNLTSQPFAMPKTKSSRSQSPSFNPCQTSQALKKREELVRGLGGAVKVQVSTPFAELVVSFQPISVSCERHRKTAVRLRVKRRESDDRRIHRGRAVDVEIATCIREELHAAARWAARAAAVDIDSTVEAVSAYYAGSQN